MSPTVKSQFLVQAPVGITSGLLEAVYAETQDPVVYISEIFTVTILIKCCF